MTRCFVIPKLPNLKNQNYMTFCIFRGFEQLYLHWLVSYGQLSARRLILNFGFARQRVNHALTFFKMF